MKMLFKVTLDDTQTFLRGVHFDIDRFDIKFFDGTAIKLNQLDDITEINGEYVIYTNSTTTLQYAHRILTAYYKNKGGE